MTAQPSEKDIRAIVRNALQKLTTGQPAGQPRSAPAPTASTRSLIDADSLKTLPVGSRLDLPPNALITPLAREIALERNIRLQSGPAQPAISGSAERAIALGADHGGFDLKEQLKETVTKLGWQPVDCGTLSRDSVDYPTYAYAVARLVADRRVKWGIIVDGAGIGSCITANKVPGVRAAMCYDLASAANSREHNHANVLTLGAGLIGPNLARQIVEVWLETPFGPGRHARRVDMITDIERRYLKK